MSKKLHPIILVGPYPPNIGGVSTHISRAVVLLNNQGRKAEVIATNRVSEDLENVTYLNPLLLWTLVFRKKSVIHFHVDSTPHLILAFFLGIFHITYLTVHNNRYPAELAKNTLKVRLKLYLLKSFDKIISVNSDTTLFLKGRFSNINPETVPAYLPPQHIDHKTLEPLLPFTKKFKFVLSGYVYRLSFFKGEDLYGVDLMVELMERLKTKNMDVCLVLLINLDVTPYLLEIKKRIKKKQLEHNILMVDTKQGVDAVALWQHSDVYLRPTNTDGNSVSILEAMYVNTKVIASDCVERPDGCLIFQNRNVDDLEKVVFEALNNDSVTHNTPDPHMIDYE